MANASQAHSKEVAEIMESNTLQKVELIKKLEGLTDELAGKERVIISQKYELEKNVAALQGKTKELEDLSCKSTKEKSELTEKFLQINEKYENIYNEHTKSTNKSKRDLALATNENDLLNQRVKDLQETVSDLEKRLKESTSSTKENSTVFNTFNLQRLEKEKEVLSKKLEEKKKTLKSLESTHSKQTSAFERERAVLEEKLNYSERKRLEIEQYYQESIQSLQNQLSTCSPQPLPSTSGESESLKLQISKLEREVTAKQQTYDRDKNLWENKFNFLIQQRDYSRKEMTAAQEKFDQIIDELKKKHSSEREKQENSASTLISSLETRYNAQMNDMQNRYELTIKEIRDKNRQLERNLQTLTEDLDTERRERLNSAAAFEKKLQNHVENEKKYLKDIQFEKHSKESALNAIIEKFSKERDEWKSKINESDKKIKEIDQQKSQIFLQAEKERVKWALEKDEILARVTEAQQQANYLMKKQEEYKREIERLRTPRPRGNKKSESGLSFDEYKFGGAKSGRSTPTNSTTDSPRVRNYGTSSTLKKNLSREDLGN
jgi:chromosome segregation ATPase